MSDVGQLTPDTTTQVVIVLGPVTVLAIIGILAYWIRAKTKDSGKDGKTTDDQPPSSRTTTTRRRP